MLVQRKNHIFELPEPLSVRVLPCAKVMWATRGVLVTLPMFSKATESHTLVAFDRDAFPLAIAFGDETAMESLFVSFTSSLNRNIKIFDVESHTRGPILVTESQIRAASELLSVPYVGDPPKEIEVKKKKGPANRAQRKEPK